MKTIVQTLGVVFAERKYVLIAVFVALAIFFLNMLSANFVYLWGLLVNDGFVSMLKGIVVIFPDLLVLPWYTIAVLSIVSILAGVVLALVWFKIAARMQLNGGSKVGIAGIVLGVLAPGCSVCGVGLLSVLGAGSAVIGLPLHGLEIGLAGIVLLVISLVFLSRSIVQCESCQVVLKK